MVMSDDAIERVKKRSYAEFCVLEKQVKAEVKKPEREKKKANGILRRWLQSKRIQRRAKARRQAKKKLLRS